MLGEVESGIHDYQYVAAFVRKRRNQAVRMVSQRLPPGEREKGSHALRVINSAMDEVMGHRRRWARLGEFTDQALQMGSPAARSGAGHTFSVDVIAGCSPSKVSPFLFSG